MTTGSCNRCQHPLLFVLSTLISRLFVPFLIFVTYKYNFNLELALHFFSFFFFLQNSLFDHAMIFVKKGNSSDFVVSFIAENLTMRCTRCTE
jgi:hypothetical protein